MKIQIRQGVFETNSSSTHSVTCLFHDDKQYVSAGALPQVQYCSFFDDEDNWHEKDNMVVAHLGRYGWEENSYDGVEDKLSYLLTMGMEIFTQTYNERYPEHTGKFTLPKEFIIQYTHSDIFKAIEDAVIEYYNQLGVECNGIYILDKMEHYHWSDKDSYHIDSYIDHQSCESYKTLEEYLSDWGITSITEYLFNRSCVVHTDNDNHY